MASTPPEMTKERIFATLNSQLSAEERKRYISDVIASPDGSMMLISVGNDWIQLLTQNRIDISISKELIRLNQIYIDIIDHLPWSMGADKKIEQAEATIAKKHPQITLTQIEFEKSATYAEESFLALAEWLDEALQEEEASRLSP